MPTTRNKMDMALDDIIQSDSRFLGVSDDANRLLDRKLGEEVVLIGAREHAAVVETLERNGNLECHRQFRMHVVEGPKVMLDLGRRSPQVWVAFDISLAARLTTLRVLRRLTGASSVNRATKAIAIARTYLVEENCFLYCQPEYRDEKHSSVSMHLSEASNLYSGKGREVQLTVSKTTAPMGLAGAIAGKIRDNVKHCLTAMGEASVAQAVYAVALAREYLVEDKIDVFCIPAFINVVKEGEEKTAVKLIINWAPYDADITPIQARIPRADGMVEDEEEDEDYDDMDDEYSMDYVEEPVLRRSARSHRVGVAQESRRANSAMQARSHAHPPGLVPNNQRQPARANRGGHPPRNGVRLNVRL